MAAAFKLFPVVYTLLAFVIYPLIFLAIFVLLGESGTGSVVVGVLLLLLMLAVHGYGIFWYKMKGGRAVVDSMVEKRAAANGIEVSKAKVAPV